MRLEEKKLYLVERAKCLFAQPHEVREWLWAARERAKRFECATGQLYSFDPLSVELQAHVGATRGRPVKCATPRAKWRFGFDAADELVIAEGAPTSNTSFVHVLNVNDESRDSAVISEDVRGPDHARVRSVVARDRDDDPWLSVTFGEGSRWYVEEYIGGFRPTRINSTWSNGNSQSVSVEWFEDGFPKRMFHFPSGPNLWVSKDVARALTVDSYAHRLVDELLRLLSAARHAIEFNCVALCVDDVAPLPPTVGVAHVEDFSGFAWADPYTMAGAVSGRDEPCLVAYDGKTVSDGNDLNLKLSDRRARVVNILVEVARELTVRLWESDRTIVYAADMTKSEWAHDVERSVPSRILQAANIRA
ncbi:MAG: hypothetical protein H6726_24580 [Sandaracinaceae bacterium]|nr:hypothetical protein [Sandaracinaceae bacterium]